MRYHLSIDAVALEAARDDPKHQLRPIRVEDTRTGEVTHERKVSLPLGAVVRYGDPQQGGARVWIETEGVVRSA